MHGDVSPVPDRSRAERMDLRASDKPRVLSLGRADSAIRSIGQDRRGDLA
jgi:hypothetical protein